MDNRLANDKDDSHKRWDNQADTDQFIWNYYNDTAAAKLISTLIKNPDITLSEVYQKLSLLRAECEWVKEYVKKESIKPLSPEILDDIVKNNIITSFRPGFANFQPGGTEQKNVTLAWGKAVAEFTKQRLVPDTNSIHGLSNVSYFTEFQILESTPEKIAKATISHPFGYVLTKLNPDFQQLLKTDNLFDFLRISSRLMYVLSNFPPVTRGSAAVNSWLIDKIAQEKFNISVSIRPNLYDWHAFLETPDQYSNFYILSTATNFIKSLNKLDEINVFEKKMVDIVMKNPNDINHLSEREELWNELKHIIQSTIENNKKLNISEVNQLKEIASGNFSIIYPLKNKDETIHSIFSSLLRAKSRKEVAQLIASSEFKEVEEYFKNAYLENTYSYSKNAPEGLKLAPLSAQFFSAYGTEKENEFNFARTESAALNFLFQTNDHVAFVFSMLFQPTERLHENIEMTQNHLASLTKKTSGHAVCKWGFIDPENHSKYQKLLDLTEDAYSQERLSIALMNGLPLNKLNDYINENISSDNKTLKNNLDAKEAILKLSNDDAILLYKSNPDIQIADLLKPITSVTSQSLFGASINKIQIPNNAKKSDIDTTPSPK